VFVIARFRVADYDLWKPVFDEHVDARIRHGAKGHRVFRADEDGNALTVILEFASRGGAEGFTKHNVSLLCALDRAGVEGGAHGGKWQFDVIEEVDAADYTVWPYQ
jgi:hypothetical protein